MRLSHSAFAAKIANVRRVFFERGFESGNTRFQGSYSLSKRKHALGPSKRALPNAKFNRGCHGPRSLTFCRLESSLFVCAGISIVDARLCGGAPGAPKSGAKSAPND